MMMVVEGGRELRKAIEKRNIKACRGNDYGHNVKMGKQKTEQ